ncbi:MAG: MoaD/ThiS family protein [Gammaproteobacteria bacterium]
MSVEVRYLASLRERFGRGEESVEVAPGATVASLWSRVSGGAPLPPQVLLAVNHEYASPDTPVRDGDEVAFLPPITGGRGSLMGNAVPSRAKGTAGLE